MISNHTKGLAYSHIAALLLSFPALFAKSMQLAAPAIIFWRLLVAGLVLLLVAHLQGHLKYITREQWKRYMLTGMIMAIHWVCFFEAIQRSTAITGQVLMAAVPLTVLAIEPLFYGEKYTWQKSLLSIGGFVGVMLVILSQSEDMTIPLEAMAYGLASLLGVSAFSLLNRKNVRERHAIGVMAIQVSIGFLVVGLMRIFLFTDINFTPTPHEWGLIFLLGTVFTAVAHTLYSASYKFISVQLASVAMNLELLYLAFMAYFFFSEPVTWVTILGSIIVLFCAFSVSRIRS